VKRFLPLLAIAALVAVPAASAGKTAVPTLTPGTLVVAFGDPAPGFAQGTVRGNTVTNPRGYEVDLATAIATKLGLKPKWIYSPWNSLFAPGNKKFDISFQEATITAQRKRTVDFTSSYLNANQGVLISKQTTPPKSLADLRKLHRFTLGARSEFGDRVQGLQGMQSVYGLTNATLKPLAIGTQYSALDRGDIDVANVFSTDGQLANGQYKVLEDPKRLFGYQHVALVIDRTKLKRLGGDRFMNVIDALNARLTTPALIEMNRAVSVEGLEPAVVAGRLVISVLSGSTRK